MATRTQTVEALLRKTVANGATQGEEDASVAKAHELCARHGLDEAAFTWPRLLVGGRAEPRTVQAICVAGIVAGLKNDAIIASVRAELGAHVRTSPGCVAWYRSKLKKGVILASGRRAPRAVA